MYNLEDLTAQGSETIFTVLQVINKNCQSICFITDNQKLVGVVTDGDIRRSLIQNPDLKRPIKYIMNQNFVSLPVNSSDELIRSTFSKDLKLIPLLDANGVVVDVADVNKTHKIPVLEPALNGRELEYVTDCIQTNWISSQGQYVSRFESLFQQFHAPMHAVSVSNGTNALHLALLALGIAPGDEVIVPNITFAATVNAVIYCGARPVLCEIDPLTWCIDFNEAEKLITPRTKAIIPVHLYGQVSDIHHLLRLAETYNLFVVEDCAESLGSSWNSRLTGTFGDASIFSFFGNKTISTGEGGMVLFRDLELASQARILRDHGMKPGKRYWHETVGFNYRLTNIQAAIGVAQMERFDSILQKKLLIATHYSSNLLHCSGIKQLPTSIPQTIHSNWLYTILLDDSMERDLLRDMLLRHGIDTRPAFYPMHQLPPFKEFPSSEKLDVSCKLARQGISLPSSVTLTSSDLDYIIDILRDSLISLAYLS